MKLIRKTQVIPMEGVAVMIYGKAGIGKSSLSTTAENSLLMCFENGGAGRALRSSTVAEIKAWREVPRFDDPLFDEFDTIVIDTLASMIEKVKTAVKGNSSRMTWDHWGQVKDIIKDFYTGILSLGKNIIFIAHAVEGKGVDLHGNEIKIMEPDGGIGKVHIEIERDLHAIGYLRDENQNANDNLPRKIYFSLGMHYATKNPYDLKPYTFFKGDASLMNRIFDDIRSNHLENQKQAMEATETLNGLIFEANKIARGEISFEDHTKIFEQVETLDASMITTAKEQINTIFSQFALSIGQEIAEQERTPDDQDLMIQILDILPDGLKVHTKNTIHRLLIGAGFRPNKATKKYLPPVPADDDFDDIQNHELNFIDQ